MAWPLAFHHHPVLALLWAATYASCIVPEIGMSSRLRSAVDAQKSDRGSMTVVIAAANLAVAAGFLSAILFPGLTIRNHWELLFSLGLAVWVGGTLFRWYSIRALGRFFTFDVAISPGQRVIERGPYRWIRHPSYLGALVGEIGFGMTLTNWLALLLPVCCLATAYVYRIHVEEQALVLGLGPAYSDYMRRTSRLIPFLF